jgi:hypothetical protein
MQPRQLRMSLLKRLQRPLLVALSMTAALRILTNLVALVATYGVTFPHVVAAHPDVLVTVWSHWDVGYYLPIAQHGYPKVLPRPGHVGLTPPIAAFAPAYSAAVAVVHALTHLGWEWCGQIVSLCMTFLAFTGLVLLTDRVERPAVADSGVVLLAVFPTAFFLVISYPESLALVFLLAAFLAMRRQLWLVAGLAAAGAAMTNFYLVIVVAALIFEYLDQRLRARGSATPDAKDAIPLALLSMPAALCIGAWMLVDNHLFGDPLAFVHAQANWGRHIALPWTLAHHTLSDLVHWRFLDTSTQSVMELFDTVTVLVLAVLAVYVYLRIRRSYGILLGVAWCVYVFQTMLYSQTREVLVLVPFFIGLGRWAAGHPWRERLLLALFLPSAYFTIERFVHNQFAG